MTPEEAKKAYDEAEPVPLSRERIEEIVECATGKRKRCETCGRFLTKDGRCVKVSWDDWNGGWEHW